MKLLHHRMVQIAGQVGDRLGADRLAGQSGHHAAHLAGGDAAQESLADQQGQLRSSALEFFDPRRKKALPRARAMRSRMVPKRVTKSLS